MTQLVQSNIQINASDVSNAVFAELQKKLIDKLNVLKEQRNVVYEQAKALSTTYVKTCLNLVRLQEQPILDHLCLLINQKNKDSIYWKISYGNRPFLDDPGANYLWNCNFGGVSSYPGYYQADPVTFSINMYRMDADGKDDSIDYIDLVGLTIRPDDSGDQLLTCGDDETFIKFKEQLDNLREEYKQIGTQINEVEGIINGSVDSRTGLTLKDYIGASIATKAIAQIPELANALNIDSICLDIDRKLISGQSS